MIIRTVTHPTRETIADCEFILHEQGLRYDDDIEGSVIIYDSSDDTYEHPVATGSYSGSVLKSIAVAKRVEHTGLGQTLLTTLIKELYQLDRTHLFLFTRPENQAVFTDLGFHPLATVDGVVTLMENHARGLSTFQSALKEQELDLPAKRGKPQEISCIVMNCNPFTLGHRAIIEHAARKSRVLYVFMVTEDSSEFRTEDRVRLVQEGVKDLDNVRVIRGGSYIISRNTFPTYFLKSRRIVEESYARLDATLFSGSIAPVLSITRRYLGMEPFCPVTDNYNTILHEILPSAGIACEIIPRKEHDGRAISASEVRRLFADGRFTELRALVPDSTSEFLTSGMADYAIARIDKSINVGGAGNSGSRQEETY